MLPYSTILYSTLLFSMLLYSSLCHSGVEMLIPTQVEWVNFTICVLSQVWSSSRVILKCWYNIHIPLVSTFKKIQEWYKECEKFLWKRSYLNASCKTDSSFPSTFNANDTKSSPAVVTAWLPSPWKMLLHCLQLLSLYMYIIMYMWHSMRLFCSECDLLFRVSSRIK